VMHGEQNIKIYINVYLPPLKWSSGAKLKCPLPHLMTGHISARHCAAHEFLASILHDRRHL